MVEIFILVRGLVSLVEHCSGAVKGSTCVPRLSRTDHTACVNKNITFCYIELIIGIILISYLLFSFTS